MVLWFAGLAFLAAWLVFRDPALDHRLIVAGALLPDLVDTPTGGVWLGHTVAGSALLLVVVMVLTRGRRSVRRHLLALPIGTLLHLVLDGAWADTEVFWWPAFGFGFGTSDVPALERGLANVPLELAGLAVAVWAWRRFGLSDAGRRRLFLRTGRLDRDLVL